MAASLFDRPADDAAPTVAALVEEGQRVIAAAVAAAPEGADAGLVWLAAGVAVNLKTCAELQVRVATLEARLRALEARLSEASSGGLP